MPTTETKVMLHSCWGTFSIGVFLVFSLFKSVSISPIPANCPTFTERNYPDMYFRAFPKDKTSRKLFVCIVYAVEVLQTALIAHDAFVTYAAGFGNLEDLIHVHLLWLAVPVLSGIGQ